MNYNSAIKLLVDEVRYRPLVPFLGAGISVASGFPSISQLNQYLAKVDFAIGYGVYQYRYPSPNSVKWYLEHPSQFLIHFGWPQIGQLDADLWQWLTKSGPSLLAEGRGEAAPENRINISKLLEDGYPGKTNSDRNRHNPIYDNLVYDLCKIEDDSTEYIDVCLHQQHFLAAIVQYQLRRDLERLEGGADDAALRQWKKWKKWYYGMRRINDKDDVIAREPELLYGNWESLLDHLCEGNFDLIDQLFAQLELSRRPSKTHQYLSFIKPKINMPLVLTTNFDRLLEQACSNEAIDYSVFDVHRDAQLPDSHMVRNQFSLLKLHGSSYGLRLGERLKYPLDDVARRKVLGFLPRDPVLVVAGFSGYERRMLQLIRAIAEQSHRLGSRDTKILWLTLTPLKGWPLQLAREFPTQIKEVIIEDSGTFFQELFYRLHHVAPPANKSFKVLPDETYWSEAKSITKKISKSKHPYPALISEYPRKKQAEVKKQYQEQCELRKPIHLFHNQDDGLKIFRRASEWATLAASTFCRNLGFEYRTIWISLETHHTVEGIVSDIFDKVRQFDPYCPKPPLNLYKLKGDAIGSKGVIKLEIEKVVSRLLDIFQRGKYVLVLDLLDCFGRPQMMHHGVPTYSTFSKGKQELSQKDNLENQYIDRVDMLKRFLHRLSCGAFTQTRDRDGLVKHDPGFGESYLCVTIGGMPTQRFKKTAGKARGNAEHRTVSAIKDLVDYALPCEKHNKNASEWLGIKMNLSVKIMALHIPGQEQGVLTNAISSTSNNVSAWADAEGVSTYFARAKLRVEHIKSLISYLSDGRPISDERPRELTDQVASAFMGLMSVFRRTRPLPVVISVCSRWVRGSQGNRSDSWSHLLSKRVEHAQRYLDNNKKIFGCVAARQEQGGYFWVQRSVRDEIYENLTEKLSTAQWKSTWRNKMDVSIEDDVIPAILNGVISTTWHWAAARTYYADTYRASQDVSAFYEYVYHRSSSLRSCTLLIALLNYYGNKISPESIQYLNEAAADLGIFSPLGLNLNSQDSLEMKLHALRSEGVVTLLQAFQRNRNALRQKSTPSTLRGWANQFLDREIHDISGSIYIDSIDNGSELFDGFPNIEWERSTQMVSLLSHAFAMEELGNSNISNASLGLAGLLEFFERLIRDAEMSDLNYSVALKKSDKTYFDISQARESISTSRQIESINENLFSFGESGLNALHDQMQCVLELTTRSVGNAHEHLFSGLFERAEKQLRSSPSRTDVMRRFFEVHTKWHLRNFPVWRHFDSCLRDTVDVDKERVLTEAAKDELDLAETLAIDYEKILRSTATASDDDRRHRSSALTLRARSLYLRGRYREGHRWLDLAESGLPTETMDQKISLANACVSRAELLCHSVLWHRFIRPGPTTIKDNQSNLQKLSRADSVLSRASKLLENVRHLPLWKFDIDVGIGFVVGQTLLHRLDVPFADVPINEEDFAKQSAFLERSVLKGMRHLRSSLDILPIALTPNDNDICVSLENLVYSAWKQLYVIYVATASCLRMRYLRKPEASAIHKWISTPESFLERDILRWKDWARSMRFNHLSKMETPRKLSASLNKLQSPKDSEGLVEVVLKSSLIASDGEMLRGVWDARRPDFDAKLYPI